MPRKEKSLLKTQFPPAKESWKQASKSYFTKNWYSTTSPIFQQANFSFFFSPPTTPSWPSSIERTPLTKNPKRFLPLLFSSPFVWSLLLLRPIVQAKQGSELHCWHNRAFFPKEGKGGKAGWVLPLKISLPLNMTEKVRKCFFFLFSIIVFDKWLKGGGWDVLLSVSRRERREKEVNCYTEHSFSRILTNGARFSFLFLECVQRFGRRREVKKFSSSFEGGGCHITNFGEECCRKLEKSDFAYFDKRKGKICNWDISTCIAFSARIV